MVIHIMKINQLFTRQVDEDLLMRLLKCFGLTGIDDKRTFCKFDLQKIGTVDKMTSMLDEIRSYYLPCKASIYLVEVNERKAITVLKQILRLHNLYLKSRERNFNNRKVMFYTLISEKDKEYVNHMQKRHADHVITFV